MKIDKNIVANHKQIYPVSCIPMSIELVLKFLGRVKLDFYSLQESWKNKLNGSFHDFDGQTIEGVSFRLQFGLPRNDQFPLSDLFATIERELKAGRYVIISIAVNGGYHMYVIYDQDGDGDFVAVSKSDLGNGVAEMSDVKSIVTKMKGTDILTYTFNSSDQTAAKKLSK